VFLCVRQWRNLCARDTWPFSCNDFNSLAWCRLFRPSLLEAIALLICRPVGTNALICFAPVRTTAQSRVVFVRVPASRARSSRQVSAVALAQRHAVAQPIFDARKPNRLRGVSLMCSECTSLVVSRLRRDWQSPRCRFHSTENACLTYREILRLRYSDHARSLSP